MKDGNYGQICSRFFLLRAEHTGVADVLGTPKKNLKIVTTEKDYIKLKNINKFKIICAEVMLKIDKPNNFKKFLLDSL